MDPKAIDAKAKEVAEQYHTDLEARLGPPKKQSEKAPKKA